ncbi:MAG: 2-oxo acid dehydrogenase subunit E2, partial [Spirochaetales bacterium]|nr:2-oxo acid dehydrogenase subunit E2 [Spirochaetales bacterium]
MAKEVLLPKQGNSVESCIIVEWNKAVGDTVAAGDVLCQVETDKAVVDVESPADGVLLKTFFEIDDEVPVHTLIALLGEAGEDVSSYESASDAVPAAAAAPVEESAPAAPAAAAPVAAPAPVASGERTGAVSPRARSLAEG